MAVLKEFMCSAHGPFEEFVNNDKTPKCPKGCSKRFVTREIRTAPSLQGAVVGTLDKMQKDIAHDFGLRDLKVNSKDSTSVMENLRKGEKKEDFAPFWGSNSNSDIAAMTKTFKPTDVMKGTNFAQPSPGIIVGRHSGPLPEV